MTRPPDHPPLRQLMADNRDKTPFVTDPCPTIPDEAYESADPVGSALDREPWAVFAVPDDPGLVDVFWKVVTATDDPEATGNQNA